jgi:hypothetical protein
MSFEPQMQLYISKQGHGQNDACIYSRPYVIEIERITLPTPRSVMLMTSLTDPPIFRISCTNSGTPPPTPK